MPNDVRNWQVEHTDKASLEILKEELWHKIVLLSFESDETNDPWVEYAYIEWYELYEEIQNQLRRN